MEKFTSVVYAYGFVNTNTVEDDRKVGRMVIENKNGVCVVMDTIIWNEKWVFAVIGKGHFETTDFGVFEQFLAALSH